ncbi:MAG: response regulator [Bryobacteraceae bacterium]
MTGTSPKSVLVVDDDEQIRNVIQAVLTGAGYQVSLACNGKQALSVVRSMPVDILVTDLIMPEQEGVETIAVVRKEFPEIKIVAISGVAGGRYLRVAEFLGAHAVLQKPFEPAKLLTTLQGL